MVKKILADGSPCPKCVQAENLLKKRGYWNRIDRTVIAYEDDDDSEGMRLSKEYNVEFAPFFVVEETGSVRVYTKIFEMIKKELDYPNKEQPLSIDTAGTIFADLEEANKRFELLEPQEILLECQKFFAENLAISFSGAEDVVLIDMASKNNAPFRTFCLDTGRLNPETYEFLETVRQHYGIELEVFAPDLSLLEPFVREKGLYSFYRDGHSECCSIRKVEPLGRALRGRGAWATGLRRDQNPATRSEIKFIESDKTHGTQNGSSLIKINPLAGWNGRQVWDYIRKNDVPYNRLHEQGYFSIGCAPCTRAIRPGEHERMARWWWEDPDSRECGLHVSSKE